MKKILVIIAAGLLASSGAFAKGECKDDRAKLCKDVKKGDHKAMFQCMKSHEAELSEGCKSARAQMMEKNRDVKKACKADYKKTCKSVKPGEGRIIKCLKENEAQLSAECKSALSNTNIDK